MFSRCVSLTTVLLLLLPTVRAGWEYADLEGIEAMNLTPDYERGKTIYEVCAVCHMPEGWGTPNGAYPQIAGQHRSVVIKQLADIRAKNRDNPSMYPFAIDETLGGAQAISDVAYYIEVLKMTAANGKGGGEDLVYGEKLYRQHCAQCHGTQGEGDFNLAYPALHGQHYKYLLRQLIWLKNGKRRNGNGRMIEAMKTFDVRELKAVSDYISRMSPTQEKRAQQTAEDRLSRER